MTALRQATILTLLFLMIILIAGISSVLLIKKEILHNVDQELRINQKKLSARISQADIATLKLASDSLMKVSYTTLQGRIIGTNDKSLFKRHGFFNYSFNKPEDDDEWRVLHTQLSTISGKNNGSLVVAINMEQRLEVLEIVGKLFLIIGALSTLTTLIVGLFIGLKNQRRFDKINDTLDKIAGGDLKARVNPVRIKDDLDQVAFHIDTTSQRLDRLVEQTRNLSANIAHDLKTPLARVRAKLENILLVEDSKLIEKAVEETLDQTDQLIAIFEAILRIAHLNSGQYRERFKRYSLAELALESADIYQPVIEDKQHQLQVDIDSDFQLMADRELLIQLIANLLENALRHTEEGSSILLSCKDNRLIVADNGPGIAAAMREKVLEPMYRLEQSRHCPGNGLGLSMVATIAELHGAKLKLSDTDPSLFIKELEPSVHSTISQGNRSRLAGQKGLTVSISFTAIKNDKFVN